MTHAIRFAVFALPLGLVAALAAAGAEPAAAPVPAAPSVAIDFNRDIRPILSNTCFACHGPDDKVRKGDLRLDTREGATAGSAVVPGKPAASELLKRVLTVDASEVMPPPKVGRKLTAKEIATLTEWIKQGAPYAKHWSYAKPVRAALPMVKDGAWAKNAIDAFILTRLERDGLKPQPEADRYTLVRRVALDLTGLPPTAAEVDAFVTDKSADAYEKMVDRVLAKPGYGEHWARMWLDLARYADSAGYADDPPRTIWGYRDYVIKSFNANKPFDQFTIEQLAGDLLPNPTDEQLVATAFHRNTLTNNEGGTNDEEFRNVAVVDRVNTTMAVWMGTSMACAQCHTHKFDPITQKEYFRFFALLNNTQDADRSDESPTLPLFTDEQKSKKAALEQEIAALEKTLKAPSATVLAGRAKWEASAPHAVTWTTPKPAAFEAKSKAKGEILETGAVFVPKAGASTDTYTVRIPITTDKLTAVRLEALPHAALPGKSAGHASNFVVSAVQAVLALPPAKTPAGAAPAAALVKPIKFTAAYADYAQAGFEPTNIVAPQKNKGWAVAGAADQPHALTLVPSAPVAVPPGSTLVVTLEQNTTFANHVLGHFRLGYTADANAVEVAKIPADVLADLNLDAAKRTAAQTARLTRFYLTVAPELKADRDRLAAAKTDLAAIKPATTVPIYRELPANQRRTTKVQIRGNFQDLADAVTEGVPAAWHAMPKETAPNRLALARWLVDADNPLTPRVIANRFWESVFGTGLVRTSEEFGSQGELPTHPELLDWLATELVREKWDVKKFLKTLVTSAAYRQSSKVTPEALEKDPDNRLLSRGPRHRLQAETVRDQALAVSGLLSAKMYGPSVKPPQPSFGLSAAFGRTLDWQTSAGEDKYRRGLYTEWRRTNPYPSMAAFDAPSREACTIRRLRSNTPLQALVTLNDPVYIEAAQALARKMAAAPGPPAEKVAVGFRACVVRPPSEKEAARLIELYQQAKAEYAKDLAKAAKMATEPLGPLPKGADTVDLAAWTVVGNVLLNLDEMFMRR
ncbi:PSD1 and planctomycete cytochrome C domain-containing protein [Fimbriiglobus ruber]|uniref:Cytochrome c domain-containing protein n=1 Tax=Fimbriiglobus ruber TaxID=1908690 RepID=A0A225DCY3_9BACT|nr:PSD1 and planctomycete cytochrome C domain-containing protein [Fimbriiglobus ruber]OWK39342.1 hypothetical protein FRUB_05905 [Fimbriiglobus ruber]